MVPKSQYICLKKVEIIQEVSFSVFDLIRCNMKQWKDLDGSAADGFCKGSSGRVPQKEKFYLIFPSNPILEYYHLNFLKINGNYCAFYIQISIFFEISANFANVWVSLSSIYKSIEPFPVQNQNSLTAFLSESFIENWIPKNALRKVRITG